MHVIAIQLPNDTKPSTSLILIQIFTSLGTLTEKQIKQVFYLFNLSHEYNNFEITLKFVM